MKYCLSIIALLILSSVQAQGDYLVTLNNDTLYGKIGFIQNRFYDEVILENDKKKETFKSFQIVTAFVDEANYEPLTFNNKKVIGRCLVKGRISHYQVVGETGNTFSTGLLVKSDNEQLIVSNIGFRKLLSAFVSDCNDLSKRITNKELRSSDLNKIIEIYNNDCDEQRADGPETNTNIELSEFAQLILDITSKMEKGEKIPNYMVEALKNSDFNAIELKAQKLLEEIQSKN